MLHKNEHEWLTSCIHTVAGGNLCRALKTDEELSWYKKGHRIALDIVRGLHFLHSHGVSPITSLQFQGC